MGPQSATITLDIDGEHKTIQATGNSDKLADLLTILGPFGIRELVQSGMVAIGRGPDSLTAD